MNSLNIISSRVSPPASPGPSRSNSLGSLGLAVTSTSPSSAEDGSRRESSGGIPLEGDGASAAEPDEFPLASSQQQEDHMLAAASDESTPLLSHDESKPPGAQPSTWHLVPKRIASTFLNSIRWVLSTLAAPGVYLIACLYDENGNFAPFLQLRKLFGVYHGNTRKFAADYHEAASMDDEKMAVAAGRPAMGGGGGGFAGSSSSSGLSSESESDVDRRGGGSSAGGRHHHGRSKSLPDHEEIAPARRSIRIKLHSDDSLRQRKHRKAQSASARGGGGNEGSTTGTDAKDISAQLKSPTSPIGALTRYPKTPAPPRPLIPRRQASYINVEPSDRTHQKTLILDLDETLIHSMSKGGRMSSGHMVEVRLNTTYLGVGGQANIGPQHPILYYVHKRPHCDDFLRRVSVALTHSLSLGPSFRTPTPLFHSVRGRQEEANERLGTPPSGMQVVQPCRLHGVSPRVCGPRHRLARVGEEVLHGPVLPPALYFPARGLHQRSQRRRARPEQGHDPRQQSAELHVPSRYVQ